MLIRKEQRKGQRKTVGRRYKEALTVPLVLTSCADPSSNTTKILKNGSENTLWTLVPSAIKFKYPRRFWKPIDPLEPQLGTTESAVHNNQADAEEHSAERTEAGQLDKKLDEKLGQAVNEISSWRSISFCCNDFPDIRSPIMSLCGAPCCLNMSMNIFVDYLHLLF